MIQVGHYLEARYGVEYCPSCPSNCFWRGALFDSVVRVLPYVCRGDAPYAHLCWNVYVRRSSLIIFV